MAFGPITSSFSVEQNFNKGVDTKNVWYSLKTKGFLKQKSQQKSPGAGLLGSIYNPLVPTPPPDRGPNPDFAITSRYDTYFITILTIE